jgi:hypothetical protein
LAEVGWVAEVTVNRTTGHVVDGHLRIELALARKEPSVPVTYVELSEDEERLVLASLDPLTAMAEAEASKLAELLEGLDPGDAALRALLDNLARDNDLESLRRGLVDPDEVPDLPEPSEVYVQPGICGSSATIAFCVAMRPSPQMWQGFSTGRHPGSW